MGASRGVVLVYRDRNRRCRCRSGALWGPTLNKHHSAVLAALGVNGILGAHFATGLFRESSLHIPDDQYLNQWTAVLAARIDTHS